MSAAGCHLKLLDTVVASSRYFFSDLGGYSINHRRSVASLCMMYKFSFTAESSARLSGSSAAVFVRNTRLADRSHQHFALYRCNTEQFRCCFLNFTVVEWNGLPFSTFEGTMHAAL
jgi:hypothetical protein